MINIMSKYAWNVTIVIYYCGYCTFRSAAKGWPVLYGLFLPTHFFFLQIHNLILPLKLSVSNIFGSEVFNTRAGKDVFAILVAGMREQDFAFSFAYACNRDRMSRLAILFNWECAPQLRGTTRTTYLRLGVDPTGSSGVFHCPLGVGVNAPVKRFAKRTDRSLLTVRTL